MPPHYARLSSIALLAAIAACAGGSKEQPAANPPAAAPAAAPGAPTATTGAPGETQYATCAACHQATGLGLPGAFPPLAGSEYVNGAPEKHIAIVLHGLTGPVTVKGQTFNSLMAPLGAAMTDDDIAAAINYERSSWGNNGVHVTAAQVAAIRAKTASRTTPWTIADLNAMK